MKNKKNTISNPKKHISLFLMLIFVFQIFYAGSQGGVVINPTQQAQDAALAEQEMILMQKIAAQKRLEDAKQLLQETTIAEQTTDMATNLKEIKEAKEKFDWLKNLKSITRLITLLESVYCLQKKMKIHLKVNKKLSLSCLGQIEINKVFLNYDVASEFIKLAIGAEAISMSPGERIRTLDGAITRLEKAINDMSNLNSKMRSAVKKSINKALVREKVTPMFHIRRGVQ